MKPCVHHTSAVVAAALAIYGRAKGPAAASPRELRSTERLVRFIMPVFLLPIAPRSKRAGADYLLRSSIERRRRGLKYPSLIDWRRQGGAESDARLPIDA